MLAILSTIKGYLYAATAAIVAFMWLWIKYLSGQNKILEKENATHEKKDEIIDDMRLADIEGKKEEDDAKANRDTGDHFNDI